MTKIGCICLILSGLFTSCSTQQESQHGKELLGLMEDKRMFELRNEFEVHKDQLPKLTRLIIQSSLLKSFNKNQESNELIDILLTKHASELHDTLLADLYEMKSGNYMMLFEYRAAYEANKVLLDRYSSLLDSAALAGVTSMNNIFQPLLNTGPQEVIVPEDNVIPIRRDVVGLMNVEVSMGDSVYTLIFDTGAGMSVIKRSFAERMGMEILETSIDVNSATGNVIKTSLAVAKELGIGSIRAKNVVFLVMEDSDLDFPQVNFFPLGAIGFPLIEELGEISISRTDTLIVKAVPTPKDLNNLGFDDLTPHVYLFNGRDTLEYAFDTGARSSHYTSKYFEKYPSLFDTNTPPDTITTGSAGGTRSHLVYALDSSALYIGNELAVLKNISCHIVYNFTFGEVYGNLGQDLIRQFDLMVLNFEDMYLEFK